MGQANGKGNKLCYSNTNVNRYMTLTGVSGGNNLYIQFLYRIHMLSRLFSNVTLGLFSPSSFMTGPRFADVRELFNYSRGFVLRASEFADVASNWAISFTLWSCKPNQDDSHVYPVDVMLNNAQMPEVVANHILSPLDKKYKATLDLIGFDYRDAYVSTFRMTSGLNIAESSCQMHLSALAMYVFDGNIIESNSTRVAILPRRTNACWSTQEVFPDNFLRVTANFTARRLVTGPRATWVNCKDEYMIPNVDDARYASFEADSIVYSLFNNASNQSSLRDIDYNGKKWDIKNEFFWLSRDEMISLCQNSSDPENINNDVGRDLRTHADDERYVYKLLSDPDIQSRLSPEAKTVLDAATALLKKSFKYRKVISQLHPEYHLNTWDMGYYQMNKLIKECGDLELQAEFKQFRELYKALDEKLYPLVYELGFLKGDPWEYKKYIKSGKKAKSDSDT